MLHVFMVKLKFIRIEKIINSKATDFSWLVDTRIAVESVYLLL